MAAKSSDTLIPTHPTAQKLLEAAMRSMDTEGEAIVQKKWHGASDDWLQKAEAAQPMGQLVKPAQLARLITYMLSPQAGVMTGSLVDYDQNIAGVVGE